MGLSPLRVSVCLESRAYRSKKSRWESVSQQTRTDAAALGAGFPPGNWLTSPLGTGGAAGADTGDGANAAGSEDGGTPIASTA